MDFSDVLSQTGLNGYIEKDSATGKIEITTFSLSIKGLSTDHEQTIPFVLGEWKLILSIFKLFPEPIKVMIGNYKSSQEETISKRKLVAVLHKYVKHEENKNRGKTQEYTDVLSKKPISKIIYKQEQNKTENKRYLFEITLPKVSISYLHHNIERNLATEDIEHLI